MKSHMSTQSPSSLERGLHQTISFFDLFEYPLTEYQLWKYFIASIGSNIPSLGAVREALASSPILASHLDTSEGLFYMKGRESILSLRKDRYEASVKKYAHAKRMIAVLARIPFVRMVCICNTLGYQAAREDSDIDLFIVARAGSAWFVRMLCAGVAHLLDVRPKGQRLRDTFCLSFYVTDDALDLSGLQLSGWRPDYYLAYWIAWCVPIYDEGGVYENFFQANAWISGMLPNVHPYDTIERKRVRLGFASRMMKQWNEVWLSLCGIWLERGARALQYRLFPAAIREQMNRGTGVVVNDSVLKFHTADRRKEIRERFEQRCREIGTSNQESV